MDIISLITDIFHAESDSLTISERNFVLQLSFCCPNGLLPDQTNIGQIIEAVPNRDTIAINIISDIYDPVEIKNNVPFPIDKYCHFISSIDDDTQIHIDIEITKAIQDNIISVYSFQKFSGNLLDCSLQEALARFSFLMKGLDKLIFEVLDCKLFFATETMVFTSDTTNNYNRQFPRTARLSACNDVSNFYDYANYELLPDDFSLVIDSKDNPFRERFQTLCCLLSLAYLSTSARLVEDSLQIEIIGQRKTEHIFPLSTSFPSSNHEYYNIYSWIYTDGNATDKAILARNIISLHCRYSSLSDLDSKTFSSIKSNYSIYLKDNATRYIDLKNKLSEFIIDVAAKAGDYVMSLSEGLKRNLLAILAFMITTVISNIVSERPLTNIFTRDITTLLYCILLGSVVYMATCIGEVAYKLRNMKRGYNFLKDNYNDLLSEEEIISIFENDATFSVIFKSAKMNAIFLSIIWIFFVLSLLIFLECNGDYSVLTPIIQRALQSISSFYSTYQIPYIIINV